MSEHIIEKWLKARNKHRRLHRHLMKIIKNYFVATGDQVCCCTLYTYFCVQKWHTRWWWNDGPKQQRTLQYETNRTAQMCLCVCEGWLLLLLLTVVDSFWFYDDMKIMRKRTTLHAKSALFTFFAAHPLTYVSEVFSYFNHNCCQIAKGTPEWK